MTRPALISQDDLMKTPQIPQNLMIAEQSIIHAVKMGDSQPHAGIFG